MASIRPDPLIRVCVTQGATVLVEEFRLPADTDFDPLPPVTAFARFSTIQEHPAQMTVACLKILLDTMV